MPTQHAWWRKIHTAPPFAEAFWVVHAMVSATPNDTRIIAKKKILLLVALKVVKLYPA